MGKFHPANICRQSYSSLLCCVGRLMDKCLHRVWSVEMRFHEGIVPKPQFLSSQTGFGLLHTVPRARESQVQPKYALRGHNRLMESNEGTTSRTHTHIEITVPPPLLSCSLYVVPRLSHGARKASPIPHCVISPELALLPE